VYTVLRCVLSEDIPNNAGFFRPIEIVAPYGSFVNPRPPAAVAARGLGSFRVTEALFGAFAEMLPTRIFACGVQGDTGVAIAGSREDGRPFILMDFSWGSWGGSPDRDGIDGNASLPVNMANISVEAIEADMPIQIERYEFVQDTGGPGQFRGGLALRRAYRLVGCAPAVANIRADRRRFRPYGLAGGLPGQPSMNWIERDGRAQELPTKAHIGMQPGDILTVQLAGAGGWGAPELRDPSQVETDILNEKITPEHARDSYGKR
jgi:N-methylhydantoinase B